MKWYVTFVDRINSGTKTVKVTASSKQEAIQKGSQKTGLQDIKECKMIKNY